MQVIFSVIRMRLAYPQHKWRNVYKGLILLEYLVKHGSDGAVSVARSEVPSQRDLNGTEVIEFELATPLVGY